MPMVAMFYGIKSRKLCSAGGSLPAVLWQIQNDISSISTRLTFTVAAAV